MAAFAEGAPCWLDVSLPDLEAGKRFYGDLFGWTFGPGTGPAGSPGYAAAFSGGGRVAALVAKRDGRMPTAWGVYFATPDADDAARRVVAAGGRMVREPLPVGGLGVVALAADPGGAVFGLWQSTGEDARDGDPGGVGFEKRGTPGSFCWTEVYTRLPEPVDAFYERVLRVTGSDAASPGGGPPFRMWSPNGATPGPATAVGGRSVMTDAFPAELPGHFLNYFAVADCDATAAAVVRLGGRVRQPPFDIPYGRMAVLTDNQGAGFAVLAGRAPGAAPGGPADSGDPGRPIDPGDATGSADRADSVDPADPVDSADSVDPVDAAESGDPVDPGDSPHSRDRGGASGPRDTGQRDGGGPG